MAIKNLIGLDIGNSAVKLIKFKKVRNKIQLEKARVVELQDGVSLSAAVAALFKSERIGACKIAISVSGQSVFTRYTKLPKISQKKIEQVIKYEAQQQIPFPIDKVVWDYQLFKMPKSAQLEVFLAAVKKDIIDDLYRQISTIKGAEVVSVQPAPVAFYNIVNFNKEIDDKTVLLDVGASVTSVIIAKGRQLWIRSIPIGGAEFTRVIGEGLALKPHEAEALKRKEGITLVGATGDEELTPRSDVLSKAINPVLTELLSEVSRSISYYKSQFDKEAVFEKVILTGGGSKIRHIERFFKDNLKIETEKANLFKNLVTNKYIKANIDDIDDRLAVAMGLALLGVETPTINLNLISDDQRKLKDFSKKKVYIISSELIALGIFAMLSLCNLQAINSSEANSKALSLEMDKHRDNQVTINELQSGIEAVELKLNFLGDIAESKKTWVNLLSKINGSLPEDTWLIGFNTELKEPNVIILEGKTTGPFDTIKSFREKLLDLGYFSGVETLRADRPSTEEELGESYNIIFTIKLTLNKPTSSFSFKEELITGNTR
ncbi:MAG: type IV pilus assembly protein PilM [Candidatus Kappaea frigidicola]|nr:type IV pilus assembly protein PilM [Candidatus Kappaea frigidicola]